MNRKSFISGLLGTLGLGFTIKETPNLTKKIFLLECYIAGFRYYDGPAMLDIMKIGDRLTLVREPENKYDADAIAIHYMNRKIGFIPASENEVISRIADGEKDLLIAEIKSIHPNLPDWQKIFLNVYLLAPAGENNLN